MLTRTYAGLDRPLAEILGNNTRTEFAYDALKRLTERSTFGPAAQEISRFAYGYDRVGNRLTEQGTKGGTLFENEFQYDSLYRLISSSAEIQEPGVAEPTRISNQWVLDGVDNWLEHQRVVARPESEAIQETRQFHPDEVNAYAAVNDTSYIYDANGNLLDDGDREYTYNYRNLLVRVVNKADGSEVASYGYDPLGRRVWKSAGDVVTRFVYDGVQVIEELGVDGTTLREYVYGDSIDDPIAMLTPSGLAPQNWRA